MTGDEPGWALAVAFGAGLLVGAERERHKGRGAGREAAGVRTFALVGLLGGVAERLGSGRRVCLRRRRGAAGIPA